MRAWQDMEATGRGGCGWRCRGVWGTRDLCGKREKEGEAPGASVVAAGRGLVSGSRRGACLPGKALISSVGEQARRQRDSLAEDGNQRPRKGCRAGMKSHDAFQRGTEFFIYNKLV